MASVLPGMAVGTATAAFAEALNGFSVGITSVDQLQAALTAALHDDPACLPACQAILDDALQDGRLAAPDHAALILEFGPAAEDDTPTEWSEDLVNEAAPASDTAWPSAAVDDPDLAPERAALLYPGAVLRNRFVLQARLKSTGMSEVFKALDRRRQEAAAVDPWVAVKLVTPGVPHYAQALQLLQQEAALAQRLQHPHIVRVFDFDRDGDYAFLTMEWLEGESLGDLLTRQRYHPLAPAQARRILAETGAALGFTHRHGVVHADVKPGNIFLCRDGSAKLLDFGLARTSSEADPDTEARTPAYASCEVLEGAAPTPQDDVYSLACVAYRMLAGRRAFGHHDALGAERAQRRPAPIRSLPAPQWAALARALALRRTARTPDVATFLREFGVLRTTATTAAPATPAPATPTLPAAAPAAPVQAPEQAAARRRSRRLPLTLAASLAVAAVTTVVPWPTVPPTAITVPAPAVGPAPADITADTRAPATADGANAAANPVPMAATAPPAPAPVAAPTKPPRIASATQPPTSTRELSPATAVAPASPLVAARDVPAEVTAATVAAAASVDSPAGGPALPVAAAAGASAAAPHAATSAVTGMAPELASVPVDPPPSLPMAAAATAAATSPAIDTTTAAIAPAPASAALPREVPLTDLHFRHYVEPRLRRSRSSPDGWVQLAFVVGADGDTREITIVDANPPGRYEQIALDAVRRWRFDPPLENGTAIARRTAVRLRFENN